MVRNGEQRQQSEIETYERIDDEIPTTSSQSNMAMEINDEEYLKILQICWDSSVVDGDNEPSYFFYHANWKYILYSKLIR